jgi:uncharacterized membrane protein (DUF2068 family)
MGEKRPFIVTLIGDISIFSAFIWIITSFLSLTQKLEIYKGLGAGFILSALQVLLPIVFLVGAFGYLRLKRWGYWLLLTSNICFLVISIISSLQSQQQSSSISIIRIVISLLFIIPTRKYFDKDILSNDM